MLDIHCIGISGPEEREEIFIQTQLSHDSLKP